jgi:hypothetical protein
MQGRKKAVSLRLNVADIKRVKKVSQRLGVRDSDVIRYAIKALLTRLSPLSDPEQKGGALVPLFLDSGVELAHQFDLDAARLGAIINDGVETPELVSAADLHLLAMATGIAAGTALEPAREFPAGTERRSDAMRRYLYGKYLYRDDSEAGRDMIGFASSIAHER